ncbi:hypothetical protein EVAR_16907_1 [Eumeta japonica]|uniref:Uncharacterized protein n=1 Tax=Eumeta variegata TaxID=151549 RepID=A0A4C1TVB3_EUMVA|nr:hypothetical protein EVAR_16907_1 [Eumeta japonica]
MYHCEVGDSGTRSRSPRLVSLPPLLMRRLGGVCVQSYAGFLNLHNIHIRGAVAGPSAIAGNNRGCGAVHQRAAPARLHAPARGMSDRYSAENIARNNILRIISGRAQQPRTVHEPCTYGILYRSGSSSEMFLVYKGIAVATVSPRPDLEPGVKPALFIHTARRAPSLSAPRDEQRSRRRLRYHLLIRGAYGDILETHLAYRPTSALDGGVSDTPTYTNARGHTLFALLYLD